MIKHKLNNIQLSIGNRWRFSLIRVVGLVYAYCPLLGSWQHKCTIYLLRWLEKRSSIYIIASAMEEIIAKTVNRSAKIRLTLLQLEIYVRLNYYKGAIELSEQLERPDIITLPRNLIERKDELTASALLRYGRGSEALALVGKMRTTHRQQEVLANFLALSDPERALELFRSIPERQLRRTSLNIYTNLLLQRSELDEAERLICSSRLWRDDPNLQLAAYCIALTKGSPRNAASIIHAMWSKFGIFWPIEELITPDLLLTFPPVASRASVGPLISVIMTTYNSSSYLDLSVGSILKQSYQNLELIIVDDASSDMLTWQKLQQLQSKDKRIKLLRLSTNSGTYVAKNTALPLAGGEFITFHDSDDWAHPQRLEMQVQSLLERPHHVACQSQWVRIEPSGVPVLKRWGSFIHTNPASLMMRRRAQQQLGEFDRVRIGADTEFVSRLRGLYGNDRFQIIQGPLTLGAIREDALTASGVGKITPDGFNVHRVDYWSSWIRWHLDEIPNRIASRRLRLARKGQYPFPVPPSIYDGRSD